MTARTTVHGSFSLERTYRASPAQVYAAFATREGKEGWFVGGAGYSVLERNFDFRIDGTERVTGRWENGTVSQFDARYFDIIPLERIVYAYEMRLNGTKISVSLATIEFKPAGEGTRLTITEHGAFLDGYDDNGAREHGTGMLMERVRAYVDGETVPA
jgi:uncharacterized protein YndB with AHSA1/START domain